MAQKFYATFNGTRKEKVSTSKKVFDKKTGKTDTKVVEREVSKPTSFVGDLNADTRSQARLEANAMAKRNNLEVENIAMYK